MSKHKSPVLPLGITDLLSENLFNCSSKELLYRFETVLKGENKNSFNINELKYLNKAIPNNGIKNLGFDFPILFERPNKQTLVVVAMDPKRNDQHEIGQGEILNGTVFGITDIEENVTRNDYHKFIRPLTEDFSVYLTDLYKIYYDSNNSIPNQSVSNKDKVFTDFKMNGQINIHRLILEKELKYIFTKNSSEEKLVIALGKSSKEALVKIFQIPNTDNIENECFIDEVGKVKFFFMPHISRTVTQSIPTISKLFIATGLLKNYRKKDGSGDAFKKVGDEMIELWGTGESGKSNSFFR
jgi:hypothetical protein